MKAFLIVFLLSIKSYAVVSPTPTVDPQLGFSISESGTDWESSPAPPTSESIKALFRSKPSVRNTQATFTVRTEKLEHGEKDLKGYVRRWLKEYPKFGYNVLAQKPFRLDGRNAYVIDLLSINTGKQARQVLSENDKTIVLLTCLDSRENFNSSINSCNTLVRNFKWK